MKTTLFKRKKQTESNGKAQQKQLRLWPGVIIAILILLVRYCIPAFAPATIVIGIMGGLLGGLAIILWWAFFSRAPRFEHWFAVVLIIVSLAATSQLIHESIATGGQGMMFYMFSIPLLCLAFVAWAVISRRFSNVIRRATMVMTILLFCLGWTLLRSNGITGDFTADLKWRWSKTAEERLLTQTHDKLKSISLDSTAMKTDSKWPGFRGLNRDGIIHGIQIKTNWKATPPVEMWHQAVGPGCSSFAIHGNVFFTQEQRGDDEVVSCYNLTTGEPVWKHSDKARFYDSHAGAGPRSTPTLAGDRVYTLGGTGILNALNASDGSVIWSRNAATENSVVALTWGFTGSPLVIGDVVIISLSGKLAAYDKENGNPLWNCPDGGNSYSSPHLVTIDGVPQVILMSKTGALCVEPSSGKQLWKYDWLIMDRILQPAVISGGDILFANESTGVRRVKVTHDQGEWLAKEVWTSEEMKLNFNDICIHNGYAYGFDGPNIACIDLKDGKRMWKGAPYRGWLLLLADQDLLIVLTEKGDLALVDAKPDQFRELTKIPAIKGRTWNHPALADDVLLVRNAEEMAAFRLTPADK
jgi:outer membrane protein assembly factor BamB